MIDTMLNEAHAISNPLMLHIPTEDHFVDHAAQQKIHEALDPNPKVTLHDYPGLDHGFAATSGNRRDEEGTNLADGRPRAFFAGPLDCAPTRSSQPGPPIMRPAATRRRSGPCAPGSRVSPR